MFTSRDFETQWTTSGRSEPDLQKVFSEQTVGIQADLFLVDDEKVTWLRLVGELAKEWKTHLFAAQVDLKKAFDHIQYSFAYTALQNKRDIQTVARGTQTNVGPRMTLQSAWRVAPATNVFLASEASRKEHQSHQRYSWLFQITSWGIWTLDGETETFGGRWTTSTPRTLLTQTTSVFSRHAETISRLW